MDCVLHIPLNGPAVSIVQQCGSTLSDVLQSKFGCSAVIDGVDCKEYPGFGQQKRPTVVPEKRFHVTLPKGVQVSVWKADLTNFQVDAVVNAANERLQHCGGLALALSNAGGPQIQKESDDYISKHGVLNTGDAVITSAGSLRCNKLIHAVGPSLSKHPSKAEASRAEMLLERAVINILEAVKANSLQTVAIPAVSSGLFNFPLPKCADIIVGTVKHYYGNFYGPHPKEIMLVNNDEPSVKEMERACREMLTKSAGRAAPKTSAPTVQIGNVRLTLKKGRIEEQQTDVIVNTAFDKDLSKGEISSAILRKAGHKMQSELYSARKSGYVIITDSYGLSCKKVCHTFCADKGLESAQQILFRSVQECLLFAASRDYRSIAFPAIGTGGLKFGSKEVAQIMTTAVTTFIPNSSTMMEVYFVIYPSNDQTYKAFEEEMRTLQQNLLQSSLTHENERKEKVESGRALRPQISLKSPYDATTREADRWLQGLLSRFSGTVVICNNFIQHFGEKEHLQLSRLMKRGVFIRESFDKGRASIAICGQSHEDVAVAALQVEAMLCCIQREFVREEDFAISQMLEQSVSFRRRKLDYDSPEFNDRSSAFKHAGLSIVKVDKVENESLTRLFKHKINQLRCTTTRRMFQRIPAQFRDVVSHVGFHSECAPPDDPAYGEGIYFASTVKRAMEVWKEPGKEYMHFVEAEVLIGNSAPGKPGLILPPAVDKDTLYDSVSGGADIAVIFSGYQALPRYIVTCKII